MVRAAPRVANPPPGFPTPGALASRADPRTNTPPHLALIDAALVDVAAGRCNRLLVVLPPQEGKSTRVVQYSVPWLLSKRPTWRLGIVAYSQREANRHGRLTRRVVQTHGPELGLSLADRHGSRAQSEWELTTGGGVVTAGLPLGGLTGGPLDGLVVDDPIKGTQQADSAQHRDNVWEWWTDVGMTRLAELGSPVVAVGTRWHEDDLLGRWLRDEPDGWRVIYVPAVAEPRHEDDPPWMVDALGRAPGEYLPSDGIRAGAPRWNG